MSHCPRCGRAGKAGKPHCKPRSLEQCRAPTRVKRVPLEPMTDEEIAKLELELIESYLPDDPRRKMYRLIDTIRKRGPS